MVPLSKGETSMRQKILLLALSVFFGLPAHAYYSVMDTGQIMDPGQFKLTPELQFVTQDGGANVGADFDAGLTDSSGLRAQIGGGDTDFYLGGFYKYMPYPDIDNQPAIGFNTGLVFAHDAGASDMTVRFEPLISKKFFGDFGAITPYGSIPLGWQHRSAEIYVNDHDNFTIQVAGGAQLDLKTIPNVGLMMEVGINVQKAFNYVSFGAAWTFGSIKNKDADSVD